MSRFTSYLLLQLSFHLFFTGIATAASITGAGSSAAAPLYNKWAEAFQKKKGATLEYQAAGSSAGIKQIKEKSVDFGASDVALNPADLKKYNLIQFPSAISGVVPVINVSGIKSGELHLTGEILAGIFAHKITIWNDAAISALNPGVRLPNKAIEVIVRSDGSGTTYNFTDYLSKISRDWQVNYGKNFNIAWHKDLTKVKGSSGIVASLKKTNYSISYVDFNYVIQDKLDYVQLKNHDGNFLSPTAETFAAALTNSSWKTVGNFEETLTDKPGNNAWPITMGTFIIMQKNAVNSDRSTVALKFFTWAFMAGDHLVNSVDLVRLPDQIQARAFKEMTTVTDLNGKPLEWIAQ
ncbi:MAG: phosphate ABC transporter substrate-binding protein PstS [Undibacterium sp.]|uniref:phosphate ABC transporter substrate-binding protein PstS n=1 Tax=Undibacterium sp. TaxID=1914977 RepID=UPI002717FF54|nr:phosphate ABC transporter substrate-binding protein PstS [Undibacterium sp.]MDO8651256.1 phosphate ABC transporter substrate-binding protein PstS [Undibacterium sp.]